jgi:hypothetical protein
MADTPRRPRGAGSGPRLPRALEGDPRHDAVRAVLSHVHPLGPVELPVVPFGEPLAAALADAGRTGRLVRGLEGTAEALDGESRGLAAAGLPTDARIARLLLVTTDGSPRFYRQVARALAAHGGRTLALAVACDATTFGRRVFGTDATAKAVGVTHKDAVAAVLLALAPEA